jgi:hypothetical protein
MIRKPYKTEVRVIRKNSIIRYNILYVIRNGGKNKLLFP